MADLLKKVQLALKKKKVPGQPVEEVVPGLMDMIRVIDRCIQWEKVKYAIKDEDYGAGFNDEEGLEK
jgi:hypothetical protein